MAGISAFLVGGLQAVVGALLVATGIGAGLGFKLIVSGALSLLAQAIGGPGRSGIDRDPRYGFDGGLRNVTVQGMPIPLIYGEEEIAPAVASAMIRPEGSQQVLYMLLALCRGEIDSVSNVRLNGIPLESFPNTWRIVKRGTTPQSASWAVGGGNDGVGGDVIVSGFNQTGIPYAAGTRIEGKASTEPPGNHVHEMHAAADELWVTLRWAGGLRHLNGDGSTKASTWYGRVFVKAFGAADSAFAEYLIPKDASGKRVLGDFREGQYGSWSTTAEISTDLRRTAVIKFAAAGRYVVRVEGLSVDDANDIRVPIVAQVTEVSNETRSYAGVAMLAIRCPAVEQLSGAIPVVTCRVKGKKIYDPRTGVTAWTRNPSLIIRDFVLDPVSGFGHRFLAADVDDGVGGSFRTFADRCEEQVTPPGRVAEDLYQLDLVLASSAPGNEWLGMMSATCRANLYQTQGVLKISEDRDGASVRAFDERPSTAGSVRHNIISRRGVSSLALRHLGESERPTVVTAKFTNRDREFRRDTVTVRDWRLNVGAITGGAQAAGQMLKGGSSGAVGWLVTTATDGDAYAAYVQDDGATAFLTGEVLTIGVAPSTSTCTTTSAPYRASPDRSAEIQLYGVTRPTQAQRLGRYTLNSTWTRGVFASWGVYWGDVDLEPGDVVALSSDRFGLSEAKYTILEVSYGLDGFGRIQARAYDDDAFANVERPVAPPPLNPGGSVPPGLRNDAAAPTAPPASGNGSGGGSGTGSGATIVSSPASGAAGTPAARTSGTGKGTTSSFFGATSKWRKH